MPIDQSQVPPAIINEIRMLTGILCDWVMKTPEVRVGRAFRLNFRTESSQNDYAKAIDGYARSYRERNLPFQYFGFIVTSAIYSIYSQPLIPPNYDMINMRNHGIKIMKEGIPCQRFNPALNSFLNFASNIPNMTALVEILKADTAYSVITSSFNARFEEAVWKMPDLSRLPKQMKPINTEPNVFMMRKLGFLETLNEGDRAKPEEEYLTILMKLHHVTYWTTLKELIETLGGVVIEIDKPAKRREYFVRDAAILLPNGQMILPEFGNHANSELHNPERDVLAHALRKSANVKDCSIDVGIDGGQVIVFDKIKGREIVFLGGTNGAELILAYDKLKAISPFPVFPVPIKPDVSERAFHLDLTMAKLPDGSIMCCPELYLTPNYGEKIREYIGPKNFVACDVETAKKAGTNLVAVGNNLIMPYCSAAMRSTLSGKGFNIITPKELGLPEGAFLQGAGGPHCMTFDVPYGLLKQEVQKNISSQIRA